MQIPMSINVTGGRSLLRVVTRSSRQILRPTQNVGKGRRDLEIIDSEGTHLFVCGDARRMAKDFDAALRRIIQEKGGKSEEQTNEYVEKLGSDKRYKRDVY